jgi:predicted flap endonuclease-1-like 5' DNA nuclease
MAKLTEIEGIGDKYAQKLALAGLSTTDDLLVKGATPSGRAEIASATGIDAALVLRFVNHADLFRIKGVAGEFSELLEAAGVDTVAELAQRNPENLHEALVATKEAKKLTRQVPSLSQVADFIEQAKALPRVVTY